MERKLVERWDKALSKGDVRNPPSQTEQVVRISLLGGFRVDRGSGVLPDSAWRRRSAKALTKVLAAHPRHALHREQVLEILWPESAASSALNTFAKALHAARRALEPDLAPRAGSAYLLLEDGVVRFDANRVHVDTDSFELLAHRALEERSVAAYDAALAAYGGELLPEETKVDWYEERRSSLRELYMRLLLGRADGLEDAGATDQAAETLRAALQTDPTREDIHRRLMVLHARVGTPEEAVRQFHACRQALWRELGTMPGRQTEALYRDLLREVRSARPSASRPVRNGRDHAVAERASRDTRRTGRPSAGMSPPRTTTSIVIADADPVLRAAARLVLDQHGGFAVAETADTDELRQAVAAKRPDVALVDIALPPSGGLEAAATVAADHPCRIVLWGYSPDPARILAALRANIYGFLPKTIEPTALVRALSGVAAGEACLSRELTSELIEQLATLARRERSRRRAAALSGREREVLELISRGFPNREVAKKLYISEFTVKRHVHNILAKLGERSRRAAVAAYREARDAQMALDALESTEVA